MVPISDGRPIGDPRLSARRHPAAARSAVAPAWPSACSPLGKQRHSGAAGTLDVCAEEACQWLGLGTPDGIHDLVGDVPVPECWVVGLALPADVEDELFR